MVTYYYLHGKCFDGDMFEGTETTDRKEISQKFKEKIKEKVNINPELSKIAKNGLPSPKYRASVYKYLSFTVIPLQFGHSRSWNSKFLGILFRQISLKFEVSKKERCFQNMFVEYSIIFEF